MVTIKEVKSDPTQINQIINFIEKKYGSIHSFKLLKYFLEHKLARENEGYTTYEFSFKIAPSAFLRDTDLINIECKSDNSIRKSSEEGLVKLLNNGILKRDEKTKILSLNTPIEKITNIYLKEDKQKFIEIDSKADYDCIVLPVLTTKISKKGKVISGAPDLIFKKIIYELKPDQK